MDWQTRLRVELTDVNKLAILGVGSELCGDDAAGMLLIDHLRKNFPEKEEKVLLMAGSTAPENFTGLIRSFRPDLLLLADAAYVPGNTGDIGFIELDDIANAGFSTHMLPLDVMLRFIQSELGCRIAIIGIRPDKMEFATTPCEAVIEAVDQLADEITKILF